MNATAKPLLNLAESRALVAAMIARISRDLDIDATLIKGPTPTVHGLRAPRESADVDVLTSPEGHQPLLTELMTRGWHPYAGDTTAHLIPQHSITLVHERWPLELDLHYRFPGFLKDPQVVFDLLWERRQTFEQAHQPVWIPDRNSSILIAALHYERAPEIHEASLEDLKVRVDGLLNEEDLLDLANLAAQTGAADTLRDFLDGVGAPPVGVGTSDPADLAAWNLNRAGGRITGLAWLDEFRQASWFRRPAVLWRAVMFTEDELRFKFPEAPAGPRGVWLARYWRLRQAIKALPQALRVLRDQRR